MGQPARRIERATPQRRRAHLSVVPTARPSRKPARKPARASAREARARSVFTTFVTLAVVIAAVGLLRVAVVARASEMTLAESRLAENIKSQRIQTDRLEIDRSSLATPSRIEEIAGATMGMGRPASVRYITMPATSGAPDVAQAAGAKEGSTQGATSGSRALAGVLGALADMSAIEAQALLVGDVSLTGSR